MACLPGQALPSNKQRSTYDARLCFGNCSSFSSCLAHSTPHTHCHLVKCLNYSCCWGIHIQLPSPQRCQPKCLWGPCLNGQGDSVNARMQASRSSRTDRADSSQMISETCSVIHSSQTDSDTVFIQTIQNCIAKEHVDTPINMFAYSQTRI